MKKRLALFAAMALLVGSGLCSQAPAKGDLKPDLWAELRFLLGSWSAKTTGGMAQAQASAAYSFRLELDGHVLARHTSGGSCKGPEDFDCQHSDLIYIYPASDGRALQAIYFDNEGHVLHYEVSTPTPGTAIFLSDPAQPGPQFRLSYELANGVMTGKFQLLPPGQKDFVSYLEWSGHRE